MFYFIKLKLQNFILKKEFIFKNFKIFTNLSSEILKNYCLIF